MRHCLTRSGTWRSHMCQVVPREGPRIRTGASSGPSKRYCRVLGGVSLTRQTLSSLTRTHMAGPNLVAVVPLSRTGRSPSERGPGACSAVCAGGLLPPSVVEGALARSGVAGRGGEGGRRREEGVVLRGRADRDADSLARERPDRHARRRAVTGEGEGLV